MQNKSILKTILTDFYDEKTGCHCWIYIIRNRITNETSRIFYHYDVYLQDNCPYHDLMVGICHEVFAEDEYATEEERLDSLQNVINENLPGTMMWHDHIITTSYPRCEKMCPQGCRLI